jgi:hypothetical protein
MMATAYTKRVLIVVPADQQQAANDAWLKVDPLGGGDTFTVPAGADPKGTPTHYCACGSLTEEEYALAVEAAKGVPGMEILPCSIEDSAPAAQKPESALGDKSLVLIAADAKTVDAAAPGTATPTK